VFESGDDSIFATAGRAEGLEEEEEEEEEEEA